MMSAQDAAYLFGFGTEQWPTSAEQVVTQFRCLRGSGVAPEDELERAKSTLLLRFYGSTDFGG